MDETPATTDGAAPAWASVGNACAEIRETHTGIVVLIGDKAYEIKSRSSPTSWISAHGTGMNVRAHTRSFSIADSPPAVIWASPTSAIPKAVWPNR